MLDAVNGELGRLFAGQGDVTLYGISNDRSAGKTGTAQLGGEQAPHSWFIGFAPAQDGVTPTIAVAVLVEREAARAQGRAAPIGGRVMAEWLRMSGDDGNKRLTRPSPGLDRTAGRSRDAYWPCSPPPPPPPPVTRWGIVLQRIGPRCRCPCHRIREETSRS